MKNLPYIIIALLAVVISIQQCNKPEPEVIHTAGASTTVYIYDSIDRPYPVLKIVKEDSIILDTIYQYLPVDTAAILADYFIKRLYNNRTLIDDTALFVSFDAVVTQNKLIEIKPYARIRQPIEVHEHYTLPVQKLPVWGFGVGGFGIQNPTLFEAGPSVKIRYHNLEFGYGRGLFQKTNLVTVMYNL